MKKKRIEFDELEENRKWLADATLQGLELLDAVSKGTQSEKTANARGSIRSEKNCPGLDKLLLYLLYVLTIKMKTMNKVL